MASSEAGAGPELQAAAQSSSGAPRRLYHHQGEMLAESAAVPSGAAVGVAEPVLATTCIQPDAKPVAMQQPAPLSPVPEAAQSPPSTTSTAQHWQSAGSGSSGGGSGSTDGANVGSSPTAESLALSVAAGSLACTLGSLGAAALGSASLALMLMALVAAALGSAASVASPGRKLFAGEWGLLRLAAPARCIAVALGPCSQHCRAACRAACHAASPAARRAPDPAPPLPGPQAPASWARR